LKNQVKGDEKIQQGRVICLEAFQQELSIPFLFMGWLLARQYFKKTISLNLFPLVPDFFLTIQ
jgi:hypothetical protein